jgi:hypothetical protein
MDHLLVLATGSRNFFYQSMKVIQVQVLLGLLIRYSPGSRTPVPVIPLDAKVSLITPG